MTMNMGPDTNLASYEKPLGSHTNGLKQKNSPEQYLQYVIRWVYTIDNHNETNYSICKDLYDIKTVTGAKLAGLGDKLKQFADQSNMQSKNLQEISKLSQLIKMGSKEISVREIPELLQKTFTNSIASIMDISKQAVEMVYILEDALKTLTLVEKSINEIEGINHKTKYLALNATIEAVRAGEIGKSFQVVASEVRDLSTDTQRLATNIGSQVSQMAATLNKAQTILQNTAGVDMSENILAKERLDEMLRGFVENNNQISKVIQQTSDQNKDISEIVSSMNEDVNIHNHVASSITNIIELLQSAIEENLKLRKLTEVSLPSNSLKDIGDFLKKTSEKNPWKLEVMRANRKKEINQKEFQDTPSHAVAPTKAEVEENNQPIHPAM